MRIKMAAATHIERMKENEDVFDFALSDADMQEIASLDREQSSFFSHTDPATVEMFVRMVEERRGKTSDTAKKNW